MQLADVFEAHRTIGLETYGLDPAYYLSAPQMSWDAMLKITGVSLELISEPAMFQMVDSGLRGGVAMISTRYAHANNEANGNEYDNTKPKSWRQGLDANYGYGHAMSQQLTIGGYTWVPL